MIVNFLAKVVKFQKIRILGKIRTRIHMPSKNPYMYGYICTSGNTVYSSSFFTKFKTRKWSKKITENRKKKITWKPRFQIWKEHTGVALYSLWGKYWSNSVYTAHKCGMPPSVLTLMDRSRWLRSRSAWGEPRRFACQNWPYRLAHRSALRLPHRASAWLCL